MKLFIAVVCFVILAQQGATLKRYLDLLVAAPINVEQLKPVGAHRISAIEAAIDRSVNP